MANINPRGEIRGITRPGQIAPLTSVDVAVDTTLNEIKFQPPQGGTGIIGITGFENTDPGMTGLAVDGPTGIRGVTGVPGDGGLQGIRGNTGFFGMDGSNQGDTGLFGFTGVKGVTGISPGDTGIRGITGFLVVGETGILGETGIEGITGVFGGETGIQGEAGVGSAPGTAGNTGPFGYGETGLVGSTGLNGITGISGSNVAGSLAESGNIIIIPIAANSLATNGDQLDFVGGGFTADTRASTTISLSFGAQTIISFETGSIADTFLIEGTILRLGAASQEAVASVTFDSGLVYNTRAALTQTLSSSLNLTLQSSSLGDGEEITQLTANIIRI